MKLTKEQKWLRTIRWLRRNFPSNLPTRIRSERMKDCGDTTYFEKMENFRICIRKSQSLDSKLDTLLHEYAHYLTWFGAESEIKDHGSEWGITYAKIYRTFLEWDFGRSK
ncbi:hypothetical protein LCGC14_1263120 [marine sediment metagenome]|uniref:SprT-like domain-containing protein n=1 Tax=marine sediment metagenome TaxID=412755 RepID=A0A0F9NGX6_9ZZZZ